MVVVEVMAGMGRARREILALVRPLGRREGRCGGRGWGRREEEDEGETKEEAVKYATAVPLRARAISGGRLHLLPRLRDSRMTLCLRHCRHRPVTEPLLTRRARRNRKMELAGMRVIMRCGVDEEGRLGGFGF